MSLETRRYLNGGNILVDGSVVDPWWRDQKVIDFLVHSGEIARSPIYDGAIPYEDAAALLGEEITGFMVAALKETDDPELFYADGTPFGYRPVIVEGKQAIGPMLRDAFYMVASVGYDTVNHKYVDVLLHALEAILGQGIDIRTVGRLRDGAEAFVSIGLGETRPTKHGIDFAMYLTAASSFNGKVATQWVKDARLALCDNTMRAVLANGQQSGLVAKVKHTKHSSLSIADAREALQIVELASDEFAESLDTLCETPVSDVEWQQILDSLVPIPEKEGRGQTMATTRRDDLWDLWREDGRVEPFKNTAFGVLQAFNTYGQHKAIVRGADRVERNYESAIHGKIADNDASVMQVIADVIGRKELAYA